MGETSRERVESGKQRNGDARGMWKKSGIRYRGKVTKPCDRM